MQRSQLSLAAKDTEGRQMVGTEQHLRSDHPLMKQEPLTNQAFGFLELLLSPCLLSLPICQHLSDPSLVEYDVLRQPS